MELQTFVDISKAENTINYQERGLIVGSCFADGVGRYFLQHGFDVTVNPLGTLYNPTSIADAVVNIATREKFDDHNLLQHDAMWHSMMHHGSFSCEDKNELLDKINVHVDNNFDYIVVTFGTAWVYQYKGRVVANCHKLPAKEFVRKRLSVDQVVIQIERMLEAFPQSKFLFTVSPIRHLKDGLVENSLSKAILRCAISEVVQRYKRCEYFPAFEIVNDQLRDYRFYKTDMVHVSDQAVDYILERFTDAFFDDQTKKYSKEVDKILLAINHKPLQANSQMYKKFIQTTFEKIEALKKTYKHLRDTKIFTNFGQF